jgi:AcrR family transcriptional regulator
MNRPTQSLRERKKERTRRALAAAARQLFLARGFEGTTVDQIAAAAEVSQRTFFRYFPTKEAVVFSEHEARLARLRALLGSRDRSSGYAGVRAAIFEFAGWYAGRREELLDEYRIVTASPLLLARDVELDTQWEAVLAETLGDLAGASIAERRRARLVAGALFGVVRAVLQEWYAGGAADDLLALGAEGIALVDRGFARLDAPESAE